MADDKDKRKQVSRKPAAGGVFDVRRPGRAPASPTSRPVILGHKPEAEAAQAAVSGVGEVSPMLTRRKIQIMPSGDIEAVSVGAPGKKEEGPAEPAEPEPRDVPEEERDALAVAAIDAVNGPPELPEQKQGPKPEEEPSGENVDRSMVFTKPKLVIEPPSEDKEPKPEVEEVEPEPAEAKPETEEVSTPDKTEVEEAEEPENLEEAKEPEEAKPEEPAPTAAEDSVSPSAAEEPVIGEDEQQAKPEGEEQDGMPKPEPHIEPLFDEHGVIVSHHDRGRRHGSSLKIFLLVLLIVFLAVVALDVLLDLDILKLNNIPHTDFL